jgi:hypothetical protein
MKARNSSGRSGLGWLMLCAVLAGCGGPLRYSPKGTPLAAGADASVVAEVDQKSSLTHLTVTAEHLPPPDRVHAGGSMYVVWARKDNNSTWSRIGTLNYDADARKGELKEASVPLLAFDLVITLEEQAAPAAPSAEAVFSQRVQD